VPKIRNRSLKRYYIFFYGRPWYQKLLDYFLNYLGFIFIVPLIFFKVVPLLLAGKIGGLYLLLAIGVPGLGYLIFANEFQSVVVRLNFKDRFLARSHTISFPYEKLLFEIEKSSELFSLFLIQPNVLITKKGYTFCSNEFKQGSHVMKLKIWESDLSEEVENIKQMLYAEYEKTANLGTHPYFIKRIKNYV
jgi:hypothetical protein